MVVLRRSASARVRWYANAISVAAHGMQRAQHTTAAESRRTGASMPSLHASCHATSRVGLARVRIAYE